MITQATLKKFMSYDPVTGIFTRNITSGGKTKHSIVGTPHKGYIRIRVNGYVSTGHRLAFLYMEGYMPPQVDHIDQNRANNKWANLRPANNTINQQNATMQKSNTSGFNGVSWRTNGWRVRITVNGKTISLGQFDTFNEAVKCRKDANIFYKFSLNHGSSPKSQLS